MTEPPPDSLKKRAVADAKGAVANNDYVKLLRYRWARAAAFVVALAALIVGVLGGFERVKQPGALATLKSQPANAVVDGGLYQLAVQSAWVSHHSIAISDETDATYTDTRQSMLHIAVTATYQYHRVLPGVGTVEQSVVWLRNAPGEPPDPQPPASAVRFGGAELKLQPGVATRAILTWRLPDAQMPAPSHVKIGLMGYKFVPSTWLTHEPSWSPDKPVGVWVIPVQDRRPAERAVIEAVRNGTDISHAH